MRYLAALALALAGSLAAPAAFADVKADVATLDACTAKAGETPQSCIGTINDTCQSAVAGQITSEEAQACWERETAAWDSILNTAYQAALKDAKAADADNATVEGGDFEPVAASLEKAERAWIAFRDAECDRLYDLYQTGTFRIDATLECQMTETATRALRLKALAAQ